MKCKLLVYNSKTKENEWIDGVIIGYRAGDVNEDFERVDVKTKFGLYEGCHPDCVKTI